jgi:hypothetical protein
MTALFLAIVFCGVVALMGADEHCREREQRSLRFLSLIAVVLTAIGGWEFEIREFREVSFHDWALLGFLPLGLLYVRLKMGLVKKQAEAVGREVSLVELDLKSVPEKALVARFKWFSYPENGTDHERGKCSDSTRIHNGNGR